ncbi:peptidase of plants and bacteria-domain-containing protein [Suillus spraguei]|nr:peptidase of plants and bacteria-domain-containing protein [Suillus spraguei]
MFIYKRETYESTWIIPNFVLRVEDLSHPGASIFFDCVKPKEALKLATITLVLRSFNGMAYTFGTHETKEINFSLDWIKSSEARAQDEILGVLAHEVVHCYQYNAKDTCPGGLIEGIADFVRLHAGFAPQHRRPRAAEKWDAGYDATAYFLDWIKKRCGEGTIRRLNGYMKDSKYGVELFEKVAGECVSSLYTLYCEHLEQAGKIPHA